LSSGIFYISPTILNDWITHPSYGTQISFSMSIGQGLMFRSDKSIRFSISLNS